MRIQYLILEAKKTLAPIAVSFPLKAGRLDSVERFYGQVATYYGGRPMEDHSYRARVGQLLSQVATDEVYMRQIEATYVIS